MASAPAAETSNEALTADGLRIDPARRRVFIHEQAVELTAREFDLLWHFASHPGRVFSRVQLLDAVWGYSHEGYEHTVNTHINRRQKRIPLTRIQTVWGVGYRFRE